MKPETRRNVILIGYRGSGKTTVGALLAARLLVPFIDTDRIIAADAGTSIANVFDTESESGFRRRETSVIARAADSGPAVISVGGGAVLVDENMSRLKQNGAVVWLAASAEVLHARIVADASSAGTRPQLTTDGGIDEVRALLAQREPLYRAWADATFSSQDRPPNLLAGDIARWIADCGLRVGD